MDQKNDTEANIISIDLTIKRILKLSLSAYTGYRSLILSKRQTMLAEKQEKKLWQS